MEPATFKRSHLLLSSLVLVLVLLIACGTAAPPEAQEATSPPVDTPAAQPDTSASAEVDTPVPTATPASASTPGETVSGGGTLTVAQQELGAFQGHPALARNPSLFVLHTAPVTEGLLTIDSNKEVVGWLAEDWTISEDFRTWTFNLPQGVEFHKGYGEMTAEDVVWSFREGWAQNEVHARFSNFKNFYTNPGGGIEAVDDYTVQVNLEDPLSPLPAYESWMAKAPGGATSWVTSKAQDQEIGQEAANTDIAATGSWEIVEHKSNDFWRMEAVEDHWLQTPHFDELVFRQIPEESTQVAGFKAGELDTFLMDFDSIPEVQEVPGAELMSIPGATEVTFNIYGGHYAEEVDPELESRQAYDPELPWISASAEVGTEEWEKARMVREALAIAIDRESIVDTIYRGFATPINDSVRYGLIILSGRLGPDRVWEYDPDRAKQLLADAGYPDGFSMTLTPSIRGAPGEVESCQAISGMLREIGIDVKFQQIPYSTLRPQLVGRTYQGATCHAYAARTLVTAGLASISAGGGWNAGATHPFLEDMLAQMTTTVDPEELKALEVEYGQFMHDNALTGVGLWALDAIWPVGPRIQPWNEHVKFTDLRNINGYEYIQPRK